MAGETVPLSELATVTPMAAPALVQHEGGERRITIGASGGASLSIAVAKLRRQVREKLSIPQGYRIDIGGEATARSDAAGTLLLVGGLVLLGVLILLASAFSSMRDAAIVLMNIPLGLVGGVIAAFFTSDGASVSGFVGFVTLFGVISRNGVMLVSHKRQIDERCPDEDPIERILRAAEERVLPIVMTATTAGLGLLPLALSFDAAGSELEAPMALIVGGGLVTSTALNLLVLPTFYVWRVRRASR
jgi:Cu/Ag efflux pump CusA